MGPRGSRAAAAVGGASEGGHWAAFGRPLGGIWAAIGGPLG